MRIARVMNPRVAVALAILLALPFASTAQSASASVSLAMDAETYSVASTALGTAPVASIAVVDSAGEALANAEVRVVFLRIAPGLGFVANETVMTTTDAAGLATVSAPQLSSLPGSYMAVAFVGGASASDKYSVGA